MKTSKKFATSIVCKNIVKEFVFVALLLNLLLTSFIYIPPLIVEKI